MHESTEVRLARIEDGIVGLHGKISENHKRLEQILIPMQDRQQKHHTEIALIKRNFKWMISIAGIFGSAAAIAVEKWISNKYG